MKPLCHRCLTSPPRLKAAPAFPEPAPRGLASEGEEGAAQTGPSDGAFESDAITRALFV